MPIITDKDEIRLEDGKITLSELSQWFGLSPATIANGTKSAKEKKFKILKSFANYHFEGRSIIIDKVYCPVYSKAYPIIQKEYLKRWGKIPIDDKGHVNIELMKQRIDTCARVVSEIYNTVPQIKEQISFNTAKNYVNRAKIEDYGHCHLPDHGKKGSCEYVWVNEDFSRPLNADELKIMKQCNKEAYGSFNEKVALIDDEYAKGGLSKAERNEAVGLIDTKENYELFVDLVTKRLGYMPDKRTMLIDKKYF